MKNTLMFLLVSLLLAFSLTACGGAYGNYGYAGQTDGVTGDTGAYSGSGAYGSDATGYNAGNSTGYNGNGTAGYSGNGAAAGNGSAAYGSNGSVPYSSLVDDTRNVLDDAGRAVDRAMNGY